MVPDRRDRDDGHVKRVVERPALDEDVAHDADADHDREVRDDASQAGQKQSGHPVKTPKALPVFLNLPGGGVDRVTSPDRSPRGCFALASSYR